LHVGPAVGWIALQGLHTWSREISVILKADLGEPIAAELGVLLPENHSEASKLAGARRAALASTLVAVEAPLVEPLVAKGVRVHTIGSDRITGGFYYFAKGGAGAPVRFQANLVEMITPSLTAQSDNAAVEACLDGVIARVLAELSEGLLSEAQIELAAALPALGEPLADGAAKLQTLEGLLMGGAARAARYEERARAVVEALGVATRRGEEELHIPLFGDAQRVPQPELEIEYAEGDAGERRRLTLPERSRWFVAGVRDDLSMPPPAVHVEADGAAADRAAAAKVAAERAAAEKAAAERVAAEKAAAEKAAAEKAAAEKAAAAERAAAERVAAEKAAAEREAREKAAAAERAAREKAVAAEMAAAERAAAEKAAAAKAAAEKEAAAERVAAEKAAAEKAAADKIAAEKAAVERAAAEKAAAAQAILDREAAARSAEKAAEKAASKKAAEEKAAAEKAAAKGAAAKKAAAEKAAADKAAAEKAAAKKKKASAAGERAKQESSRARTADTGKRAALVESDSKPTPLWVWMVLVVAAAAGAYYFAVMRRHG
jgi:hypothetical protein